MFYKIKVKGHIRVSPHLFREDTKKAILKGLTEQFSNFISQELGIVIGISSIQEIKDGIIIPGDGAAYYDTLFEAITFKPEMQEAVLGSISEITDFGAFIGIGSIDGMIHISQTMDDYVSFSKTNVLTGKESKKTVKTGDRCIARIIAISYKDPANPKIGLTMRQVGLGNLKWIEEEIKMKKQEISKAKKEAKKKTKK